MRIEMTVNQLVREIMTRADAYPDSTLAPGEMTGGNKLGIAMLTLMGRKFASEERVRGWVESHAGRDGRISTGEFEAISAAIRGVTQTLPAGPVYNWPSVQHPLGVVTRFLARRADVDLDGIVGPRDVAAGSAYAAATLETLQLHSATHASLEPALRRRFPSDNPNASAGKLLNDVLLNVVERGRVSISIGDWTRGDLRMWDTNQDLQLTAADGPSARRTLALAGIEQARSADLTASVAAFDVRSLDGTTTPDGRLDASEMQAYSRAWLAAGGMQHELDAVREAILRP
jgi:hypothetical protein